MNRIFILTALVFSAFMCCQKQDQENIGAFPAHADQIQPAPTAESLEVRRAEFVSKLAECRTIVRERNASPQITITNPTQEILAGSKRNNPPE